MRKLLSIFLFSCISVLATAQPSSWEWGKKVAMPSGSNAALATDGLGNIYQCGSVLDSTTSGKRWTFLTKYDANGTAIWTTSAIISNTISCGASAVCTDASGNVYVTGYFYGGSIKPGTAVLTGNSANPYNLFIAKYNTNGNLVWAHNVPTNESIYPYSIAADDPGNVYVAGVFLSKELSFDTDVLKNTSPFNSFKGFLVKYNSAGKLSWARSIGSKSSSANALVLGSQGSVYVCGSYSDSLVAGASVFKVTKNGAGYIIKYSSDGTSLWAKTTVNSEWGLANISFIGRDAQNNLYLMGTYEDPMYFGVIRISGFWGTWMARLNENGDVLWAKSLMEKGSGTILAVKVHPDGRILIGGNFKTSYQLESKMLTSYASPRDTTGFGGNPDMFLAGLNSNGTLHWLQGVKGGKRGKTLAAMTILPQDEIAIAGFLYDYVIFGKDSITALSACYLAKTTTFPLSTKKYISPQAGLNIYPNPANNAFYINSSEPYKAVNVYNLTGQLVHTYKGENRGEESYDISMFSSGVYMLEIQMKNTTRYFKLIKQ